MSNNDKNPTVGYGRPPELTKFQKGKSGNPRGRPKGKKNISTMWDDVLYDEITIRKDGKLKKVTVLGAVIMNITQKALGGDIKAQQLLLKIAETRENNVALKVDDESRHGVLVVPGTAADWKQWEQEYSTGAINSQNYKEMQEKGVVQ